MGRPVKDYRSWTTIVIPHDGDWRKSTAARMFLNSNTPSTDYYEIREDREWPAVRTRHTYKQTTAIHYYIKDPKLATMFTLRFAR